MFFRRTKTTVNQYRVTGENLSLVNSKTTNGLDFGFGDGGVPAFDIMGGSKIIPNLFGQNPCDNMGSQINQSKVNLNKENTNDMKGFNPRFRDE